MIKGKTVGVHRPSWCGGTSGHTCHMCQDILHPLQEKINQQPCTSKLINKGDDCLLIYSGTSPTENPMASHVNDSGPYTFVHI